MNLERMGPITVVDVFSAAVRIRHTRAHIDCIEKPSYMLITTLQREQHLTLDGCCATTIRTGEYCLLDQSRPYEIAHGDGVRTLSVEIPQDKLEERVPEAAKLVGKLMRPDSGMSRVLVGLLRNVSAELSQACAGGLSPSLGQNLLSMIAATYSAQFDLPVGRGVKARARAYRAYVDSRLEDPDLTPADVASHFGISERYLRAILSADGESFSAYILRRRLSRCAQNLQDPNLDHSTITAIALDCGFGNSTYFGQAFRNQYGVTPRDFRNHRD